MNERQKRGKSVGAGATLAIAMLSGTVLSSPTAMASSSPYAGKTITVAYQQFGGATQQTTWFKTATAQFEKQYPGAKVKLEPINASENQYYTKLDLMNQSARTAPDVIVEDTFLVNSDASAGYLMPMNKYVGRWKPWHTEFYRVMQQAAKSSNGTIYGVPFTTDTRGIWYDKSVFKKAGLPSNWQPKTWNQILKAAEQIKKKEPNVTPLWFYSGKPMGEASTMQGFEMLLYGTHNTLYDFKTHKWIVKSPGFLNSLKFIQTIFSKHLAESLPNALTPQSETVATQQLMPKHQVGMLITGDWIYSNWLKTGAHPWPQWHKYITVAKMPKENGHGYTSMSGGWVLSISSKSKVSNLAWDFIKIATDKKNMLQIDLTEGNVTPRKDVASTHAYKTAGDGMLARFASFDKFTHFRPANSQYPSVSNEIQSAMENVMTGMSPQQAMNQYAQAVTGLVGAKNVETVK